VPERRVVLQKLEHRVRVRAVDLHLRNFEV